MKLELSNGTFLDLSVDFYSKSLSIRQFRKLEGELQFSEKNPEVEIKIPFIDLKKLVDFCKDIYKLVA